MAPFVGDFDPLDPNNAPPKRKLGTRTVVLAVCIGVLVVLGVAWVLYDKEIEHTHLPVIRAQEGPHTLRPTTPDTAVVPHQDKKIYERIHVGEASPQVPGHLTPEILAGGPDHTGQRIVTRETPIPVTEGLRTYTPPPPGLPGLEEEADEDAQDADDNTEDGTEEASEDSESSVKDDQDVEEEDTEEEDEDASENEEEDTNEEDAVEQKNKTQKSKTVVPSQKKPTPAAQHGSTQKVLPTQDGKFQLQIASSTTRAGAEEEWKRLHHRYVQLKNVSHQIVSVDLGEKKGVRYRVYVGGWPTRADVQKVKVTLKNQGLETLVVQP